MGDAGDGQRYPDRPRLAPRVHEPRRVERAHSSPVAATATVFAIPDRRSARLGERVAVEQQRQQGADAEGDRCAASPRTGGDSRAGCHRAAPSTKLSTATVVRDGRRRSRAELRRRTRGEHRGHQRADARDDRGQRRSGDPDQRPQPDRAGAPRAETAAPAVTASVLASTRYRRAMTCGRATESPASTKRLKPAPPAHPGRAPVRPRRPGRAVAATRPTRRWPPNSTRRRSHGPAAPTGGRPASTA